jgi:putative ATP-dependent endonuclease of the OLD family
MTTNPTTSEQNSGIRVDAVRIRNFRSLKNVEVLLGDTSLLVGMNNAGKTSFLRALHLALGADRRLIAPEDFFIDEAGNQAAEILIDVRIVPVGADGNRMDRFPEAWVDSDFGGSGLISTDTSEQEFIGIRTQITYDSVKSDFNLERRRLQEWPDPENWAGASTGSKVSRFNQLLSFFIDAQRDVVADLRVRTSYFGKLLSKVEFPAEAIAELEQRLSELNDDICGRSEVLGHIREALTELNRTVPAFGEGVELTPVSKKIREITKGLGVRFSDSGGSSFPLESHGMGTRSWASLLSFQAYVSWTAKLSDSSGLPFHPVLFLEEPEAHLHPNAQRAVHGQLAKGPGQRIVSTHSPYIAGQADLSDLLHFSKQGTETKVRRVSVDGLNTEDIRKIRREVMRSRGELLFAQAVVLFEGETEEQALPMFARHHWGRHPFERGVSFVGVGGDGNYLPFLRIFEAMQIRWFILSDGEPNSRTRVERALSHLQINHPDPRVVTLPNDMAIEGYLVDMGYEVELKNAVVALHGPYDENDHRARLAKVAEVAAWDEARLRDFLKIKRNKTPMAPLWAQAIIDAGDERAVPPVIRQLLDAVDRSLSENGPQPELEP